MATTKATHVVKHRNLYMSVKGKLQHFPAGTQLTLTDAQAKKMGGRVGSLAEAKSVDLTGADGDDSELEVLRARGKELGIEGAHKMGAPRLTKEIATVEEQLAKIER